ncbi:MAG: tetratricopeptide repeat protein [Treponema sp.]|nr:tetratricopeptide repeat protein [Treponema sp.]
MKKLICALLSILSVSVFAQSKKLVVSEINAYNPKGKEIIVSWTLPKGTDTEQVTSLIIYRDTKPIKSFSQTETLIPLATLPAGTLSYTDKVRTSSEYFYAVISMTAKGTSSAKDNELYFDEELDKIEIQSESTVLKLVLPGVNSTVTGTKIKTSTKRNEIKKEQAEKEKKNYSNKLREQPLPYMNILENEEHKSTINESNKKMAEKLAAKTPAKKTEPLPVYIFDEDLISPPGGDDYLLFEILRTTFIKKKYSQAAESLKKFLARNRSASVTERASFYLGECYYFTGKFEKALPYFLSIEDSRPELSRKWTENTIDMFSLEGK